MWTFILSWSHTQGAASVNTNKSTMCADPVENSPKQMCDFYPIWLTFAKDYRSQLFKQMNGAKKCDDTFVTI